MTSLLSNDAMMLALSRLDTPMVPVTWSLALEVPLMRATIHPVSLVQTILQVVRTFKPPFWCVIVIIIVIVVIIVVVVVVSLLPVRSSVVRHFMISIRRRCVSISKCVRDVLTIFIIPCSYVINVKLVINTSLLINSSAWLSAISNSFSDHRRLQQPLLTANTRL